MMVCEGAVPGLFFTFPDGCYLIWVSDEGSVGSSRDFSIPQIGVATMAGSLTYWSAYTCYIHTPRDTCRMNTEMMQ